MKRRRIVLAGFWLGLIQTGLGYAILAGAGTTLQLFYAALGVWIAGGAAGALLKRPAPRPLLFASGIAAVAAAGILTVYAFEPGAAAAGIAASGAAGVFAGRFIVDAAARRGDAAETLLLENSGFAAGLFAALVLLFADPAALAGAAALLWGGLLIE